MRRQRSNSNERRKKRSRSRSRSPRKYALSLFSRFKNRRDGRRSPDRSRSRERDRHRNERSEQQQREDLDQRIRLAMRGGTFQHDSQLQLATANVPQEHLNELYEQAMRPSQMNEPILVRELFISGLPDMSEPIIRELIQGYGQIEGIEICKNFAFVKFLRVEDASNACADYHNINMRLHNTQNPNFKMFFADHLKRWNVVSNNPEYEIKEHLIPVVYASIRNDPKIANEEYLRSVFSKYGPIRNLMVKQNQSPGPKVYALVEYECLENALKAREKLSVLKDKLGDRRGEVTILLDTAKVMKVHPNVANQLKYQKQNIIRMQQQRQAMMEMYNPMPTDPGLEADPSIYDMLMKIAETQEEEVDWSGFFMRNKRLRVGVDLRLITKAPLDLEFVLNVSHRGDMEDGLTRLNQYAVGKFRAADHINVEPFGEYIRYFQGKGRAGIIESQMYLIFLIPPGMPVKYPYEVGPNELLAIFYRR